MIFGALSSSYEKRYPSLSESTSSRYDTISSPEEHSLAQKVSKIALLNLREHDLDICACEQCIYSRQLNRKHRIGLDLSKNSSYRAQFDPKHSHNLNQNNIKIDYEALQKQKNQSAVIQNSSYGVNYSKDTPYEKPQKKRPEDELKFVGPVQNVSSYGEQYPAFKNNANPYVKPTEVTVPNTLKMNVRSVYQSNFNGALRPRAESGKMADHLHGGLPWTGGGSTYREIFKGDSPGLLRDTPSRMDMKVSDPNYVHQYQTTYRNEYLLGRKRCSRGQAQSNPLLARLQQTLDL